MQRVKLKRKIERVRLNKLHPKQRVHRNYNPKEHGTVVQVGPEVSEVKWDNGSKQIYESNQFLQPLYVEGEEG